ncbi:9558_t:CDS:2, partial [Entrophospora sp. SA101]
ELKLSFIDVRIRNQDYDMLFNEENKDLLINHVNEKEISVKNLLTKRMPAD